MPITMTLVRLLGQHNCDFIKRKHVFSANKLFLLYMDVDFGFQMVLARLLSLSQIMNKIVTCFDIKHMRLHVLV